jgi:hypothetical protein
LTPVGVTLSGLSLFGDNAAPLFFKNVFDRISLDGLLRFQESLLLLIIWLGLIIQRLLRDTKIL